jgi:hypothetical protein
MPLVDDARFDRSDSTDRSSAVLRARLSFKP